MPVTGAELNARLRALPSVEELAARVLERSGGVPRVLAVRGAREAIAGRRHDLRDGRPEAEGDEDLLSDAVARAVALGRPRLRPVLNATGVIVHTNLGRAPLPDSALEAVVNVGRGYSNLEYDLDAGRRGSRGDHVEALLCELTGAEAALAVNNCAAAVTLAAAALAGGREVVVSRGQLVEIGGSFRVPDVIEAAGARLAEVGTTNRTRRTDYERAVGPGTGALMRAHPSNFRQVGFVEETSIEELCEVGRELGVPVIDDAGSGALVDGLAELADEPPVRRSVEAGCAVVCFSGDKLLGGPQAGVMVGSAAAIERCRRHPLARAVRIDKLSLAALEATLALLRDPADAERAVPVLAMLRAGEAELRARAERISAPLRAAGVRAEVITATGRVGGGTLPLLELEGPVCAVDPVGVSLDDLAARLRGGEPPLVARVGEDRLVLDPRTLDDAEADLAAAAVLAALGA